jgi:hypothetical protein
VTGSSAPTITPTGSASAVAAINLRSGAVFNIDSGNNTLFLQGYSSGNAIFLAGDGTAGEYIDNGGTVAYSGVGSGAPANIDYLKIPVHNGYTAGTFKVNGNVGSSTTGSVLQISGADTTNTSGVSFYQNGTGETDIYGQGTLWCVNDFKMNNGKLQTTDNKTETLKVGTSGSSPVDGTVTITGGTVNINPGTNVYGTLAIVGTRGANVPTLNVGSATLNFKVNGGDSNTRDQLSVGYNVGSTSTGKANFGYNSGTTTVAISAQGTVTTGHNCLVILFATQTGDVTLSAPTGFTNKWNNNSLEIDN